ncbi:MAG: type II secretion system protein M [Gammaproteobacteria bacterium]|nr:type II secretion system protein M [Gammaproteobacteria bacterium]MCW8841728.1 type II secretion system protein M [Gammaproteobacteria bacterium]MCW8927521.1 type II secretion system protein M [Gammaproteobacteria bacterium]MCW8958250.1 type II secretion system protein M [Gammaproteobacteria bacterium]MCW8973554.1 type II secretion system protein M [Gammaproteobacteria bacterium]
MKQYLMSLQSRERYTLLSGAVVLLLLLVYLLLIEPFVLELNRLEKSVAAQQQELAWMQDAVAQVQKLRAAGSDRPRAQTGQSLLSLVDTTARELGLGAALKQLSPVGEKVRIRLEQASFDTMLRWLGRLEQQAGVGVDTLTLERLSESGMINATVVLQPGRDV